MFCFIFILLDCTVELDYLLVCCVYTLPRFKNSLPKLPTMGSSTLWKDSRGLTGLG